MQEQLATIEAPQRKARLAQVKSGDTVRVHQTIREGGKKRTQIFEGVVIRLSRADELAGRIVVRKIASGVGVEKSWLLHSPNVIKIEIIKRTKVRRAYLTYLRARRGKSARLSELGFDKLAVNEADDRTHAQIKAEDEEKETEETIEIIESDSDLAKEEGKQAAQADPEHDRDETMSDEPDSDDALIDQEEIKEGLDRSDNKK